MKAVAMSILAVGALSVVLMLALYPPWVSTTTYTLYEDMVIPHSHTVVEHLGHEWRWEAGDGGSSSNYSYEYAVDMPTAIHESLTALVCSMLIAFAVGKIK